MILVMPNFVTLGSEYEYRQYFKKKYCDRNIKTFDGITVRFYEDKFDDAFFESSDKKKRSKDIFSIDRAKRIDWIEYALMDRNAELHVGWDRDTKTIYKNRRVALINSEDYVVIIEIKSPTDAKFITAYYANNSANKIRQSPLWK